MCPPGPEAVKEFPRRGHLAFNQLVTRSGSLEAARPRAVPSRNSEVFHSFPVREETVIVIRFQLIPRCAFHMQPKVARLLAGWIGSQSFCERVDGLGQVVGNTVEERNPYTAPSPP